MKLRLLNTSHLAIAGLGRLMGHVFIDETLGDARIAGYMAALMDRETGPTVPPVPGVDLTAYKASLIERFANPTIKDTVERVNTDAPLNYLTRSATGWRAVKASICWPSPSPPGSGA
jgi:mannitol 2-dehydrogenase